MSESTRRPGRVGASWQAAIAYAARQHQGQVRKDGRTPYAAHPFRVALTLRHVFGHTDDATLCAAVLHDTIEDTTSDFDEIEEVFGTEVAELVAAMSKNMLLREDQREPEYDARLRAGDWRARLIKLADVYDNLHDITHRPDHGPKTLARHLRRCERAIALAEGDRPDHPEVDLAIAALRAAMSEG